MTAPETRLMLKPCPFCGSAAALHEYPDMVQIECGNDEKCAVSVDLRIHDPSAVSKAIEQWNTRAIEPARSPPGSGGALRETLCPRPPCTAFPDCGCPIALPSVPEGRREEIAREALDWYASEAGAAARYMAQGKTATADALLAILTVLANDGGKRARDAILALCADTRPDRDAP